jgi:hypothetical protein
MKSVFWALVRKDVYLMRGFMIATVGVGVLAVLLMRFGRVGFAVGGILFLTANVASGIFIPMYSLLTERKERSRGFALSLPVSGASYERSKLTSAYLTYGLPWLVLTTIAVLVFLLRPEQQGMVVYALVLQFFVLAIFSFVLSTLLVVPSEAFSGVVILFANICFSLFMVALNQPAVAEPLRGPQIVWTPFALWMLCGELLVVVLSLAIAILVASRKRDYI